MMTVLEASSHVLIVTHAVSCSQATMAVVLILRYLLRVTDITCVYFHWFEWNFQYFNDSILLYVGAI